MTSACTFLGAQVKEKHSAVVYAKYCFCSAPTGNRASPSRGGLHGGTENWQQDGRGIPPPF